MNNVLDCYTRKSQLIVGLLIIIVATCVNIFVPLQVKNLLDTSDFVSEIMKLVALVIAQTVLMAVGNYTVAKAGEYAIVQFRKKTFTHLVGLPISFFEEQKSGELTHRLMEDFIDIRRFISSTIPNFISSIILIVGSLVILFMLDWQLCLMLFLALLLFVVLVSLFSNVSTKFSDKLKTNNGKLSGVLNEIVQQIKLIKFSSAQPYAEKNIDKHLSENYTVSLKVALVDALVQPIILLLFFAIMIFLFTYGGLRIQQNDLSIATLISFLIYLLQLLTPFSQIGLFFNEFAKIKVSLDYIHTINAQKTEDSLYTEVDEKAIPSPEKLVFEHVDFSYNAVPVLKDISLQFEKGKKVALVGPSGSGKSTILKLIERLYVQNAGVIKLNNIDAKEFSLKDWRKQLAVVDQDTVLLSTSVYDNLLLGVTETKSLENIKTVLNKASLLEDIEKLSDGLQTEIGERGVKLSGGQQQRLQIARAFLKDAPILLMDEPTANLDSETENVIARSISELAQNKIAIIVAHRLSTIVDADCIYFIENGQVTGEGTHAELLHTHEKYQKFVTEQMISFE